MHHLTQFLAFIFSRQMLAFIAVLLLALVVWFIGPLVAVGSLRPLEPVSVRAVIVAVLLVACVLYGLHRLLRGRAEGNEKGKEKATDKKDAPVDAEKVERQEIAATVQRAVGQLKGLRSGGVLRRLFGSRHYLYELPWYMIVGSPGAGKTTALLNSGQQFPAAHQMEGPPALMALQSRRSTVHADWWFSNEAVLIDTAGRYTWRETDTDKDAAPWRGFLGLLRKHRTRAPVNGVIVALSAAELLQMDAAQCAAHAVRLRERLGELREKLGIRFPVYIVVTKMDVLAGFGAYFRSLTSEGRTQAWGFTLPFRGMKGARRAADIARHRAALSEQVDKELALLVHRMKSGLRARLNEEYDGGHRRHLSALPEEFAALSATLARMIDEVFLASRFDGTQSHHAPRGVYFTSGGQAEVDLPADRHTMAQQMWHTLGLSPFPSLRAVEMAAADTGQPEEARKASEVARTAFVETPPTRGQTGLFLQDLLAKIIIPEAHLVRPNLRWEIRFRLQRLLGYSLVLVISLSLAGALALSFGNNKQYLATVAQRAVAVTDQVRALVSDAKPRAIPDVLNAARELPGYSGLDLASPPGSFR